MYGKVTASNVEENPSFPLPREFVDFLNANGIDASIYSIPHNAPRYIRLKSGSEHHLPEIENNLQCNLESVPWLPNFYSLPGNVRIANSNSYKEGKMYGIDAASGAAVMALDIATGDHVLDLCAAPGAKLCMILDLLGDSGSVTAVDISRHRLAACRTMVQKYNIGDRCRLFLADGTAFNLLPLRSRRPCNGNELETQPFNTYALWSSKTPWKQRQKLKKKETQLGNNLEPELMYYGKDSGVVGLPKGELYSNQFAEGYDKVLVDAECTHDGSFGHIKKFGYWGWESLHQRVVNAQRSDELSTLQLNLLKNGFKMLKVGGTLIYSTCSFTVFQNEDIVRRFLEETASAELKSIEAAKDWPCRNGQLDNTYRFDNLVSSTSGLFLAMITKLTT